MTDSSKGVDVNKTLTAIGAVLLVHLLLTSSADADSSSFHKDSRESKLEDDWRPMSDYRHIRYINNTHKSNTANRPVVLFNGTNIKYENLTDSNVNYTTCFVKTDSRHSYTISNLKNLLNCFFVNSDTDSRTDRSISRRVNRMVGADGSSPLIDNSSYTAAGLSNGRLRLSKERLGSVSVVYGNDTAPAHKIYKKGNKSAGTSFNIDRNEIDEAFIKKIIITNAKTDSMNSNVLDGLDGTAYTKSESKFIATTKNDSTSREVFFNNNSNNLRSKINLQIIDSNKSGKLDEDDEKWWKIVISTPKTTETASSVDEENDGESEFDNESKNPDRGILNEFISNSLSDLRLPGPQFPDRPSAMSGPIAGSLDDLILHRTGSPVKEQNRPRPSVILIHDAPDEFLPKPRPDYQATTPVYQYDPSPVHVQINNYPPSSSVSPSYRPHEPVPEPEYVPVAGNHHEVNHIYHYPKPDRFPAQEPVYKPGRPVYHDQSPIHVGVDPGHKPIYYDPKPPLYKPYVPVPEPGHGSGSRPPIYRPVTHDPIPEPDSGYASKPTIFKPVHYNPSPEPNPEPVHIPVYLYPKPGPQRPSYGAPGSAYSPTTFEPLPSLKPVDPPFTPPGVLQSPTEPPARPNTPLGPTLIFIDSATTPATPARPAEPPVPSPFDPLVMVIPSGKPPPSIVLLPPLGDQAVGQSAAICPTVFVTNNQNIHTTANFKDGCPSNVNVIVNAPVSAAAGNVAPIAGSDYQEPDDTDESHEEDEEATDDGQDGGTALFVPAPVPVVAGGGGGIGAAAGSAPVAAGGALVAGAPVAAAAASAGTVGGYVTSNPAQNDPAQTAVTAAPTKKPQTSQSMSLWDHFGSILNSLVVYPLWTIIFGPFSLLVASGLGVAALVFPWAFPRFWFGRRQRKKRTVPILEFEPIVSALDYSAAVFESRLKTDYDFHKDYNR